MYPPYMPFSIGDMSQVIFGSTPTLYRTQGDYATAKHIAGMRYLSVGYPRGEHSGYMTGCCLISLRSVQRGNRSKNSLRHITYGKGHIWGIPSLPLYFLLRKLMRHLVCLLIHFLRRALHLEYRNCEQAD